MKPSKDIIELEHKIWDLLEEYFPKGKHKDRGKVLVLIALSKELGVQGHVDLLKQRNASKSESESMIYPEKEVIDKIINLGKKWQVALQMDDGEIEHVDFKEHPLYDELIGSFATPKGFRKAIEDSDLVGTNFEKKSKDEPINSPPTNSDKVPKVSEGDTSKLTDDLIRQEMDKDYDAK